MYTHTQTHIHTRKHMYTHKTLVPNEWDLLGNCLFAHVRNYGNVVARVDPGVVLSIG